MHHDATGEPVAAVLATPVPAVAVDGAPRVGVIEPVKGVITPKEASDLTGRPEQALVAEVEAWAAAEEITAKLTPPERHERPPPLTGRGLLRVVGLSRRPPRSRQVPS